MPDLKLHPGEYLLADGEIEINAGRATAIVLIPNTGDRPIQVGSHFHFFEVNKALHFGCDAALRHASRYCRRHSHALRAG
jgi:urease beta subunit